MFLINQDGSHFCPLIFKLSYNCIVYYELSSVLISGISLFEKSKLLIVNRWKVSLGAILFYQWFHLNPADKLNYSQWWWFIIILLNSIYQDGERERDEASEKKKRRFVDDGPVEMPVIPGPGNPSPGQLTGDKVQWEIVNVEKAVHLFWCH